MSLFCWSSRVGGVPPRGSRRGRDPQYPRRQRPSSTEPCTDTRGISTKAQNATTAERQTPSINERREGDVESETSLGRPRVRAEAQDRATSPRVGSSRTIAYDADGGRSRRRTEPGIAIPCSDSRTTDGAVVRRFSDTRRSSVGPTGRVAATDAWLGDRQSLSDGRAVVLPTPAPTAPAATVKTAPSVPPATRPLGESAPRARRPPATRPLGESFCRATLGESASRTSPRIGQGAAPGRPLRESARAVVAPAGAAHRPRRRSAGAVATPAGGYFAV